jgi:hypothetical protein
MSPKSATATIIAPVSSVAISLKAEPLTPERPEVKFVTAEEFVPMAA